MKLHYLEFVSPDADLQCKTLQELHGVTFSEPVAELGHARIADLPDGSRVAVRSPMHAEEEPVIRPYFLTTDIEGAVENASKAGAQIAHPPLEIPGPVSYTHLTLPTIYSV